MTRAQGWLVVTACVLLAAWLTSRTRPPVHRDAAVLLASPAAPIGPDEIRDQSDRLRAHLASPPPFTPPHRNPFRFRETARPPVKLRRTATVLTTALAERGRSEMSLVGIAEDGADGAITRTAIVAAMAQLFFVKEGERVLGRYQVVRITSDAAQLRDTDGQTFTIALR
jgi:hypothetical protein